MENSLENLPDFKTWNKSTLYGHSLITIDFLGLVREGNTVKLITNCSSCKTKVCYDYVCDRYPYIPSAVVNVGYCKERSIEFAKVNRTFEE